MLFTEFSKQLQACHRVTSPSRRRSRSRTYYCASSFVSTSPLVVLPLWCSWIFEGFLLRLSSHPFSEHVHRCSGIDHEFSLVWLCEECGHCPMLRWASRTQFSPCFFELIEIFAKFRASRRAPSSLLQGFFLCFSSNFGAQGLPS